MMSHGPAAYDPRSVQQVAGATTAAADDPVNEAAAQRKAAGTEARVCAVIVTYGDRFRLVRQVIEAGFACGVRKAIVVDNNCVPASSQALEALAQGSGGSVDVVGLPENRGSAGGYKAGIERVLQCEACDYVWLLDDDNVPRSDALLTLLQYHEDLSRHRPRDSFALASCRDNRKSELLACGVPPRLIFPPRSSFHKYHLLHRILRLGRLFFMLRRTVNPAIRPTRPIPIPYAPYGGLFVHKSVLFTIGAPDDRLFLYVDDAEYTNRLVRNGGKIFFICSSIIRDIELTWARRTARPRTVTADSDVRVYYSMRNWAYFDSHYWIESRFMYTVNKYAFLTVLLLHALVRGRWRRFRMILRAVKDGEATRFVAVDGFASVRES